MVDNSYFIAELLTFMDEVVSHGKFGVVERIEFIVTVEP